ncbi:MAG TPA: hypothetical protein VL974_08780 [Magnetospirillum sp.]|jgi:hypothetical protein|nr:hypothetical protein [Magnetospirillum sp.]
MTDDTLPPMDMDAIRGATFWRVVVTLAAFLVCLGPVLVGILP